MKKLSFFLLVFALVIGASAVQASVTAPNVTIQKGGGITVFWRAPLSQTYKVSVFVPNNATAVNALYRVYPKGKLATSTTCLSTDATHPCFEIPVNQALNKNKWVQLMLNKDVNTQWTFVKNSGFVTVASANLSVTEKLGVAGINFLGTALSDQQISANWAKAISSVSGIRAAISRCMNDNAGVIAGLCDYAGYDGWSGLGKYGILETGLTDLNAGTTSGIPPNTQISVIAGTGAIQLSETVQGALGGCTFQIVPTMAYGSGVITWTTRATAFTAPAMADADCTRFINDRSYVWYSRYNADQITSAKWTKALASVSGIRLAISECINDNAGVIYGLCDYAGYDGSNGLGKYGILETGLADLNFGTTSGVRPDTQVSIVAGTGAIQITETVPGSLGGCTFQIVPTIAYGSGTITWTTRATAFVVPATSATDCTKFVKGSIAY